MLCEECHQNEATVLITLMVNGHNISKHFCAECMDKMKANFVNGNFKKLHSTLFSTLASSVQPKVNLKCSRCGLSFNDFQETVRFGCAQCYQDFAELLKPVLLRIHGRNQHLGRVPLTSREERERNNIIMKLRAQLEQAVQSENFEEAAVCRDKLKEIIIESEGSS